MRPKPSDDPVMKTRAIIVSLSDNLINEPFANFESLVRASLEGTQPEVMSLVQCISSSQTAASAGKDTPMKAYHTFLLLRRAKVVAS